MKYKLNLNLYYNILLLWKYLKVTYYSKFCKIKIKYIESPKITFYMPCIIAYQQNLS